MAPDGRKRPSLVRQLILWIIGVSTVAFVTAAVYFFAGSWSDQHLQISQDLGEFAEEIGRAVQLDGGALRLDFAPDLSRALESLPDLQVEVVHLPTGAALGGALAARLPASLRAAMDARIEGELKFSGSGTPLHYGNIRIVHTSMGDLSVGVFRSATVADDIEAWLWHELFEEVLPLLLPVCLAIIVVALILLRRAFNPLRALAATLSEVSAGTRGTRLSEADLPLELVPFVHAVNEALDCAERAVLAQREFAAEAAHQIRTPLAVLRARLDSLPASVGRTAIDHDVERLARIVHQLLDMSRLDSGQIGTAGRLDLAQTIADCVADLVPLALAQDKEIVFQAPENPVIVHGDRQAIEDAARNLVENALRFNPPRRSLEVSVAPGARVSVRDHGPGVPEHLRSRIFDRFFRGDEREGGVGLGLAIVARTAAFHGGGITVENHPEGGAVFTLFLPQALPPRPRALPQEAA